MTDSDDAEPITIGLLAPQPKSNYIGRSMKRAARLAVDELNADGGLLGRDVELAVGDTNTSPTEARRQYQRLILEKGADVTVGVFDSLALRTLIDEIAEQETLHLSSASATAEASRLVREEYDRYKYHFRVGPTNGHYLGRAQVDFVADTAPEIGLDSVALLAEDYEWTQAPWDVLAERLDGTGVSVEMAERYPAETADFREIYGRVEDAAADAALIVTAHTGTDAVLDWSYPNRPETPPRPQPFAFGGIHVPMQFPTFYDATDEACRHAIGLISATPGSEFPGGTREFVTNYRNEYDDSNPVYTGYHTYDAVTLFAHVVEERETLDTESLIDGLESVEFDGVAGPVEFYDRDSDYPHDLVYADDSTLCFQWQETDEGEPVQEVIWPENRVTDIAHGEYVDPSSF